MFRDNTVFIIGAGASFEADLPLGSKLKESISDLTKFEIDEFNRAHTLHPDFFNQLRDSDFFRNRKNDLRRALRKLSAGVPFIGSLDSFLEIHREDMDVQHCTKAAIAREILSAEKGSKIYAVGSDKFSPLDGSKLSDAWYLELAYMLFEKADPNRLSHAFSPVKFIVFNYDRCLEWFIFNAVRGLYFLTDDGARRAMENLTILHPYGDVGGCPWLGGGGPSFGDDPDRWALTGAQQLRTFSERVAENKVSEIREVIRSAERLVFLGLSFHPENLELITPTGHSKVRTIVGTRKGISESAYTAIKSRLQKSFTYANNPTSPHVNLVDTTCFDFLRSERRSLVVDKLSPAISTTETAADA